MRIAVVLSDVDPRVWTRKSGVRRLQRIQQLSKEPRWVRELGRRWWKTDSAEADDPFEASVEGFSFLARECSNDLFFSAAGSSHDSWAIQVDFDRGLETSGTKLAPESDFGIMESFSWTTALLNLSRLVDLGP